MANADIFERYLDFRIQKGGALTPSQKLEVVDCLLREAKEEGKVPSSATSVTRLPVSDPAVQAALRGEDVSLGAVSISGGRSDWRDITTWPTSRKLLALGGVVLAFLVAATFMFRGTNAAAETATATPTEAPSPTPDWIATMTAIALIPTDPPPPPPLPPTPTMAFVFGQGGPAESSRDPASIEIAGRLFIVSRGEVIKDTGQWLPQGPEWLSGTEVRRVFAIPYASVSDLPIATGSQVMVRTRGGQVLTYRVRDVVRLLANQIETFVSLRPSLVVVFPLQDGDANTVERYVLFGEAESDAVAVEENAPTSPYAPNAYVVVGANLRDSPSLVGNVLVGMPPGTPLMMMPNVVTQADGHVWIYVLSPYGYGWVAQDLIAYK